jgi:hypothetical protein
MPRLLPTAFITAINSGELNIGVFIEASYAEGAIRLWNGIGPITVDGVEWTGSGNLVQLEPFEQSRQLESSGLKATVSVVSPALISAVLASKGKGRGRPFRVLMACMDSDFENVLSDGGGDALYQIAGGFLDETYISENGSDSTMTITGENEMVRLFRANHTRYTDGDQKRIFPSDKAFEYVAAMAGKQILWGVN